MTESNDAALMSSLEKLGISTATYEHEQAFTVEEQAVHVGKFPGVLTKNLFLRDKKHGLFLLTVLADREVNLKVVGNLLNLSGANLRFGDEELLQEKLKVIKGAVSPFAVVNDVAGEVVFCIDKDLVEKERINIHPLRNDRTVSIVPSDLFTFLEHINHKPVILDFSAAAASAAASSSKVAPQKAAGASKAPKGSVPVNEHEDSRNPALKRETQLGMSVTKEDNFADWYTEALTKSEMIDYSDISGRLAYTNMHTYVHRHIVHTCVHAYKHARHIHAYVRSA